MAKQGENREEIQGTKRLYRVLAQVDSNIELPAGLTAHALLPKLERVEQPIAPIGKIRFSPKIFTWQSGVTYAAAFALILMLSSVLTRGDQPAELLHGEIAPAVGVVTEAAADDAGIAADIVIEETVPVLIEPAAPEAEVGAFATRMAPSTEADAANEVLGIGGQSESILLGNDETYTYLWRVNDPTDPDKEGYPVTVNIVDTVSGELAAVLDIPDMLAVEDYYIYNDVIAFTGHGEDSAVLFAADISDKENILPFVKISQQGTFTDSSLYGGMLHFLTVTEQSDGLDCEIVQLPGSESDACCVVTVVNLDTGGTASKAFSGVSDGGGEIYLYNLHAYVNYDGAVTEGNATGKYLAQIRLDGMNIELTGEEDATAATTEPEQPEEESEPSSEQTETEPTEATEASEPASEEE